MKLVKHITVTAVLASMVATPAMAKISPAEASKLGNQLTPVGAIKAGNKEGTIPEWAGGITKAPKGFKSGQHHPDPYANDKVKFKITSKNYKQYKDKLSAGHVRLFELYPNKFSMNVYQTRRSAGYPKRVYRATKQSAVSAKMLPTGNGVVGSKNLSGVPFPIPKTGLEVVWNHIMRYRGDSPIKRRAIQALVNRSGSSNLVTFEDDFYPIYSIEGMTEEKMNNVLIYFKQKVTSPARLAGGLLLVHETLDQNKQPRKAWVYNPGQRRVRRAPNVAFDNPREASDGLVTTDQYDMFSGSPERYDWKLEGLQEMYIPYNSYKLHSNKLKYKDILTPLFMNRDVVRYELHRVWKVTATLKPGMRHIYKKRVFYFDEDSWQLAVCDIYDGRNKLWRMSVGHILSYYDVLSTWTTVDEHIDVQSGRYVAMGLNNEEKYTYEFGQSLTARDFQPAALRRAGRR